MNQGNVVTMDEARAEQCDKEIQVILEKYQCDLVVEQRLINGVSIGVQIYSMPRAPKVQG